MEKKYVTAKNFHTLEKGFTRVKPLPPGSMADKSSATLYQFNEHVEFRCAHCRTDGIVDDAFALDSSNGRITCQRCYARIIRPRNYRPTRLVPFPTMVSWLNFKGATTLSFDLNADSAAAAAVDGVGGSEAMMRMAEAAIPSDSRAKGGAEDEYSSNNMNAPVSGLLLPATPIQSLYQQNKMQQQQNMMNPSSSSSSTSSLQQQQQQQGNRNVDFPQNHPCESIFGHSCTHGATCMFTRAPGNICLEFFMGICFDSSTCGRLHDRENGTQLHLPPKQSHPDRWKLVSSITTTSAGSGGVGDDDDANDVGEDVEEVEHHYYVETDEFKQWVQDRKNSKNQAEWQLWNQDRVIENVVDRRIPMPEAPKPTIISNKNKKDSDSAASTEKASSVPALDSSSKFTAASIESMLKSMKKS